MDAFCTSGSSPTTASVTPPPAPACDLVFEYYFSLFLIRASSQHGQQWLDENVGDENTLTFGGAIVCEPRYVEDIFLGASATGLVAPQ